MDELLIKYMLGEADEAERQKIHNWLEADRANRKKYEDFKTIWEQSRHIESSSLASEDDAWRRFVALRDGTSGNLVEFKPKRRVVRIAAAASIAMVMALSLFLLYKPAPSVTFAASDEVRNHTLSDGTVVTLNRNSKIIYASEFKGKERQLKLEGEAFFNVAPDKKKPFVISVDDVKITVVGTSFNVRESSQETEVVVETGEVLVESAGKSVRLRPNDMAIAVDGQLRIAKTIDSLYSAYRTGRFVCDNTPLWRLVEVLNGSFDKPVKIQNPAIRELRLTTTFEGSTQEEIISTITATLNIKAEFRSDEILLHR